MDTTAELVDRYFNPRSRKGSDSAPCTLRPSSVSISIHAPARGATLVDWFYSGGEWNFNPRSRKGSDMMPMNIWMNSMNFNPRSRKGSDVFPTLLPKYYLISIHAPARGATNIAEAMTKELENFNPRSRKGSDHDYVPNAVQADRFQSTLPQGERPMANIMNGKLFEISIHAPARGATATAPLSHP